MKQNSTILIVDDQRLAQKKLALLLKDQGYRLVFASDGPEALAKATKIVPDLILLDVVMPGMDGFEVCRRLRAHTILAEVPIIMITSLDDRDTRLRALELGADDFVAKPFDRVELQARVGSITRLNRYRRLLVERVRFRWVVENAEEGYLTINEEGTILYANPRARVYLNQAQGETGQTKPPPINKDFLELARQYYNCEPHDAWLNWPYPATGDSTRYLVQPESTTARAFWLQVDILNLPAGPNMAGIIRLRDVTTRMNTLRDMRGFSSTITHKLRTPMGHIIGSLDLLKKYYRETVTNPDVAELFETAHKGAQRLSREIDQVMRYSRDLPVLAQAGDAFKLTQLQPLVSLLDNELEMKSVSVTYQQCPGDACITLTDRAFELILWEILENAKKFHPKHAPNVEVRASCIGNHRLCLRVSDDGVTLTPDQLASAWTPYYQGEKNFTGELSGMGLGLTMVAALVWSASGKCHLYNRVPGPGVVVELTLPLLERES